MRTRLEMCSHEKDEDAEHPYGEKMVPVFRMRAEAADI